MQSSSALTAPTAAASVGEVIPARSEPRTAKISAQIGSIEVKVSHSLSRRDMVVTSSTKSTASGGSIMPWMIR